MAVIKIGERITYKGGFGLGMPERVTIKTMEITEHPREKYGESVEEVDTSLIQANRVIFSFTHGHWAYSDQIILAE